MCVQIYHLHVNVYALVCFDNKLLMAYVDIDTCTNV